jgi:hypothetical protein
MNPCNAGPCFFVVPVSILLTVSFFVLVVLQKVTLKNLKNLGMASVILLWLAALLICATGIYGSVRCGKNPVCPMNSPGNRGKMMKMGGQGMMDESAYPPEMIEMMKDKTKPATKNIP